MTRRTIVLLGAGASRDAGLPLTSQLAQMLVAKFNAEPRRGPEVQALNFVYSAMIGHQGEDGSDPLRAVNIETLISAVRLLQSRESHEVAPFVSAWKAGALGFGPVSTSRSNYGREARSAVVKALEDRHWGGDDLVKVIERVARDVSHPREDAAFVRLEAALLQGIRDALSDLSSVEYLRPLADLAIAQAGGLDIVTLNYDRTIETMAAEAGVELDTGIDRWIPGIPLSFKRKEGRINLFKLHGSVDWELVDDQPGARTVRPPKIQVIPPEQEGAELDLDMRAFRRSQALPWIVVGDREKLATDGPTLDLLHAAGEAFNNANYLVVVGYSFSDAHINAIIRNWMAADPDRTMTVLDPAWPSAGSDDPRRRFAREYGASSNRTSGSLGQPRIAAVAESTGVGLVRALRGVPAVPEPYATADWAPDASSGAVIIRLLGPSLIDASIHTMHAPGSNPLNVLESRELRDEVASRPLSSNSWRSAQFRNIEQGDEVRVFLVARSVAEPVELILQGSDLVGERVIRLALPPVPPGSSLAVTDSTDTPQNTQNS